MGISGNYLLENFSENASKLMLKPAFKLKSEKNQTNFQVLTQLIKIEESKNILD